MRLIVALQKTNPAILIFRRIARRKQILCLRPQDLSQRSIVLRLDRRHKRVSRRSVGWKGLDLRVLREHRRRTKSQQYRNDRSRPPIVPENFHFGLPPERPPALA